MAILPNFGFFSFSPYQASKFITTFARSHLDWHFRSRDIEQKKLPALPEKLGPHTGTRGNKMPRIFKIVHFLSIKFGSLCNRFASFLVHRAAAILLRRWGQRRCGR
jgi:hypothetical protein